MKKLLAAAAVVATLAAVPVFAQVGGNLAATPAVNLELNLTGAAPALSATTFELVTGDYYRLTINSDGGAEALFTSPEFFQNIWMNQIVVSGIEVGEAGVGAAAITFVPIRPGEYPFWIDEVAGIGGTFIVR